MLKKISAKWGGQITGMLFQTGSGAVRPRQTKRHILYQGYECPEILRLLQRYGVKECYFGHLHGAAQKRALEGRHYNTEFHLVAADYLDFTPVKICD